jgi:mono/diheme cytochrome c family protein
MVARFERRVRDGRATTEARVRMYINLSMRLWRRKYRVRAGTMAGAAMAVLGMIGAGATVAHAFPWSTDMFQGPAVQPLEMAPRAMPEGTLPINGIHYNTHYGQPAGMPDDQALAPMKLELMTVKLHNPVDPTPENLAHGQHLFETDCAPCHGMKGKGDGTVVHLLQHKPANLMTGVSKNLPDGYIYGYIRNGGIWMPEYDDAMSSKERWQVVVYLRALQKEYGEAEASAGGAASPAADQAGGSQPAASPPSGGQPAATP